MWCQRLVGPGRLAAAQTPPPQARDLAPGELLVRLRAAAVCGSDIPKFRSGTDPLTGQPGFPCHECVGTVVASRSPRIRAGQRVLALPPDYSGLVEYFVAREERAVVVTDDHLDDATATLIQPLACVLAALDAVKIDADSRVVVIGLGPIGLLAGHALRARGVRELVGVDPVERRAVAEDFGFCQVVTATAAAFSQQLAADAGADLVVEAVGHQQATLADAIETVRPRGHILAVGLPGSSYYAFPFERFFYKNLTLTARVLPDWGSWLPKAEAYLRAHAPQLRSLITHTFPVSAAQQAYELYATYQADRLKVALVTDSEGTP